VFERYEVVPIEMKFIFHDSTLIGSKVGRGEDMQIAW
jgi:hypothetical protein